MVIFMDMDKSLIVISVFFFAAFVKGTTGLGFSTICLPILAMTLGIKETLPLLIVPSLLSNIIVMVDAGHFRSTLARFWPLFVSALLGIPVGLALLAWIEPRIAGAALGFVLIAFCAFSLARPEMKPPANLERPLGPPVGIVTGAINGLTGVQVIPVLPYLLSLRLSPNHLIQAINCWATLSGAIMAVGLAKLGLMTWDRFLISAIGLVPVYAGVRLGNRARRWLPPETFGKAVLLLLALMGATLIARLL
jgi:uncharacterized membrane protein YfcA